jgi:hypothetical protein
VAGDRHRNSDDVVASVNPSTRSTPGRRRAQRPARGAHKGTMDISSSSRAPENRGRHPARRAALRPVGLSPLLCHERCKPSWRLPRPRR